MERPVLRAAREASGRTLDEVVRETALSRRFVEAIDNHEFHRLPAGVYARAYLRTYARAAGLDPTAVLERYAAELPAVDVQLSGLVQNKEEPALEARRYRAAALTDALVVLAIAGAHLWSTAAAAGIDVRALVGAAAPVLPALVAAIACLYVGVLGATGVGTAGARLYGVEFVPRSRVPLDGAALVRRAVAYLRQEAKAIRPC